MSCINKLWKLNQATTTIDFRKNINHPPLYSEAKQRNGLDQSDTLVKEVINYASLFD